MMHLESLYKNRWFRFWTWKILTVCMKHNIIWKAFGVLNYVLAIHTSFVKKSKFFNPISLKESEDVWIYSMCSTYLFVIFVLDLHSHLTVDVVFIQRSSTAQIWVTYLLIIRFVCSILFISRSFLDEIMFGNVCSRFTSIRRFFSYNGDIFDVDRYIITMYYFTLY